MVPSKTMKITSWVITGLVALFLIGPSALGKFVEWEGKEEMFTQLGFTTELMAKIGVLEIVLALLLLIPRTSFLGAILLTGYLGGATVTHVRVGDPFYMPIIIGVVMWVGLACRKPEIFALVAGAPAERSKT
jgi:multidrug efflux pump subunit AcrB